MDFDPPMFRDAPIGSVEASACTPALADDALGVVVAAPALVSLGGAERPVIPLCGAFQLRGDQTVDGEPVTVHVLRVADGARFSGVAVDPDPVDEPDIPPPDDAPAAPPEALANTVIEGVFHIDAQASLAVVLFPAHYEVVVSVSGALSAPVPVEIAP